MFYLLLGLLVCAGLAAAIFSILYTGKELRFSSPLLSRQQPGWRKKSDRLGREGIFLRKKLLRMLHYDQSTVDRLLTMARYKYPGHSQQWYLEKVIYDLQRDRRS